MLEPRDCFDFFPTSNKSRSLPGAARLVGCRSAARPRSMRAAASSSESPLTSKVRSLSDRQLCGYPEGPRRARAESSGHRNSGTISPSRADNGGAIGGRECSRSLRQAFLFRSTPEVSDHMSPGVRRRGVHEWMLSQSEVSFARWFAEDRRFLEAAPLRREIPPSLIDQQTCH